MDRRAPTVKALARHFIGLVVVGIAIGLACWPLNVVDRLQSLLFARLPTTASAWSWPGIGIALLPVVVMPTLLVLQRGPWRAGAGSGIPSTMNALEDPGLMPNAMATAGTVATACSPLHRASGCGGFSGRIATAAMFPLGVKGPWFKWVRLWHARSIDAGASGFQV